MRKNIEAITVIGLIFGTPIAIIVMLFYSINQRAKTGNDNKEEYIIVNTFIVSKHVTNPVGPRTRYGNQFMGPPQIILKSPKDSFIAICDEDTYNTIKEKDKIRATIRMSAFLSNPGFINGYDGNLLLKYEILKQESK
jgi:hypothetical protein